ncbi:MAG: hypothetical protein R6U63_06705 [Longimicrobiales bacterium]
MAKRYILVLTLGLTIPVMAACGSLTAPQTTPDTDQEEPEPGDRGDGTAAIPGHQIFFA